MKWAGRALFLVALAASADVSIDSAGLNAAALKLVKEFKVEGNTWTSQGTMGEDGTYVMSYDDKGVSITHVLSGERVLQVPTNGSHPHDGALTPDGRHYALTIGAKIQVFDLKSGKEISSFEVDSDFC